jgi:hypothetical protein
MLRYNSVEYMFYISLQFVFAQMQNAGAAACELLEADGVVDSLVEVFDELTTAATPQ